MTKTKKAQAINTLAALKYAKALIKKLDECEPYINSMCTLGAIHGMPYSGPSYDKELERLRKILNMKKIFQ